MSWTLEVGSNGQLYLFIEMKCLESTLYTCNEVNGLVMVDNEIDFI